MKLPKQVLPVCHDNGYEYQRVGGRIVKVRIPREQLAQPQRRATGNAATTAGC